MNDEIILRKLESLQRCLQRIEAKLPKNIESFTMDLDSQDIVLLNLERAIQMVIDIGVMILKKKSIPLPNTYSEIFIELKKLNLMELELSESTRKAVSFRNIAVHEYTKLNLEKVYELSQNEIRDLKLFGKWVNDLLNHL